MTAPVDSLALPPLPEGINCPDCGYDLRSLTGPRCPECGFDLAIIRTQTPQIPWSRRGEIGRFKAYWQTVWVVCRHPRRFYVELVRPVSYRDSQSFRWVTFLHAFVPLLICMTVVLATEPGARQQESLLIELGVVVGIGLVLIVLPGVQSYNFETRRLPTELRNRCIALSYYAWAPLATIPIVLLFMFIGGAVGQLADMRTSDLVFYTEVICAVTMLVFPLLTVFDALRLCGVLACGVLRDRPRIRLRMTGLTLLGFAAAALAIVIPGSIFYFLVMWYSLR